jgi:CRP/FNR family cyclic AMP-dependent transcriptional regulator
VDVDTYAERLRDAFEKSRLGQLDESVRSQLTDGAVLTSVQARRVVPYDPESQVVALVVDGLLRTFVLGPGGRQITLRYSRPGAVVGTGSLFAKNVAYVQMQALIDTSLLLLRPDRVRSLARTKASVADVLLHELAERTAAYMALIAATGLSSVRQRVVRHLFDLASEAERGHLVAHLTQQELADHVGSVREVVARILRDLREEGLITTGRDQVVVVDPTALHARTWPANE